MKVVINKCFGGFSLSPRAVAEYARAKGKTPYWFRTEFGDNLKTIYTPITEAEALADNHAFGPHALDGPDPEKAQWIESRPDERSDPLLIEVIERMGLEAASGAHAELAIVEIPDGTDFVIEEYDGSEHIAEAHRTWR